MRQSNVETGAGAGRAEAGGRNMSGNARPAAAPCFFGRVL
jgi:hypothetical protein